MKDNQVLVVKGIVYANIFAIISFAVAYAASNWNEAVNSIFIFSEFVLVPVGMGIIAMKFWIKTGKRMKEFLSYSIINTIIAIILSAVFMREGIICLVIVSPLIVGFMWTGVVIGKYIFLDNNNTLKASTFLIFIILFTYDSLSEHYYVNSVTDQIIINAPADVVWKYITAHPVNSTKPGYWLFNIGLPYPVQSTVTADTVGAQRKCIFSNNATFDEVVVESNKGHIFTFDIVKQPVDPEIIGHINIQRGQFILKENGNGTTTLTGTSWYKLNVYPVWYYDLWAIGITRNVHLRVMQHIKNLAEKNV